ncbi:MAG: T9SS type A sorting domain-containing protein [Flavobacteriales bacterium]|nr:T9SS type A sorting domain-containing protein [Flavobacteriales bacterium]
MRNLIILPFAALVLGQTAFAQSRQSTCFWGEDFELGIPADWSTNQVERQTSTGSGLGEFVPAFIAGTSTDADANGYFDVADMPVGNRFAMANDDAPPCNCDLDSAVLATPVIDLSGIFNAALDLRVHHTQALGGGEAWIDFSINGTDWQPFELIPAGPGWQRLTFSMNLLGGISTLQLRFRWSDSGAWASGFAVDDLCIRETLVHDLAVTKVRIGDESVSPFTTGGNGVGYRLLPLEQSRPLSVSADLHNVGSAPLYNALVTVTAQQNGTDHGPFQSATIDTLLSGERITVFVQTDWAPDALGEVTYTAVANSPTGEEDPNDNQSVATITITGPGWDDGYGAMAIDAGVVEGAARSNEGFIAALRFELVNEGSTARGISAVIDPNSQVGQEVRGILMDGNFSFIDTTLRHAISPADIEAALLGLPLYLPFPTPPVLSAADHFAGLQRLVGSGSVGVLTSGTGPIGAAAFMEGLTFDIDWLTAMPMVRLHLSDYGVGVAYRPSTAPGSRIYPMPVHDRAVVEHAFSGSGQARVVVRDAAGRELLREELGAIQKGAQSIGLDLSPLANGAYMLQIEEGQLVTGLKMVVAR